MNGPAGILSALLTLSVWAAVATPVAAAADRFVPRDPGFVVANISQSLPDPQLQLLLERWRAAPDSEESTVTLARAFIEHARVLREPRYFGRAEALLESKARGNASGVELRRLYAETLQFRHAFTAAEAVLDDLLREQPHDGDTRLRRGSLRLTRGDFAGARADCAQITLATSHRQAAMVAAGFACLAEALAGSGELDRARLLLDAMTANSATLEPAARAYLLASRAELSERAGEVGDAIDAYREASGLAPQDDSIRAALADALVVHGNRAASVPLQVDKPSLALLVRQAALARDPRLLERARDWLALEAARGDAIHHREAALLALAERRPAEALAEARRNFETQRELADVRVLARAAMLANDVDTRSMLDGWLRSTGYQDAITAGILAGKPRG